MLSFRSLLSLLALSALVAAAPKKDWKDVEGALGRAGTVQPDGAYKLSFPRGDLSVTVDAWRLSQPWRSDRGWRSRRAAATRWP